MSEDKRSLSNNFGVATTHLRNLITSKNYNGFLDETLLQKQTVHAYYLSVAERHGFDYYQIRDLLVTSFRVHHTDIAHFLNGTSQTSKSRDFLIGAAIVAQFTVEETQELLKLAQGDQQGPLYAQNLRDLVILYSLENHLTLEQTQTLFRKLNKYEKETSPFRLRIGERKSRNLPIHLNSTNAETRSGTTHLSQQVAGLNSEDQFLDFINRIVPTLDEQHYVEYLVRCIQKHGQALEFHKSLLFKLAFSSSDISRLFSGKIHFGRNKLLICALLGHLTPEETDQLLIYANHNRLYPRNKRDAIILKYIAHPPQETLDEKKAISNHFYSLQEELTQAELETLTK